MQSYLEAHPDYKTLPIAIKPGSKNNFVPDLIERLRQIWLILQVKMRL